MTDSERFKLLFGPYRTARFRLGQVVTDEARDREVVIVGVSEGRIPWPIGKPRGERGKTLVVFGALAEAIRRESNQSVCFWWGITAQTVTKWRKALGIGATTEGTSRLRSDYCFEEPMVEARKKSHAKAGDPARRAKIAAAKRGKPRPWRVIEAVRKAHLGMKTSDAARRKMSESHKDRGTRPPKAGRAWTPEEDEMVRTFPAIKAAVACKRTLLAVYHRRSELKVNRV